MKKKKRGEGERKGPLRSDLRGLELQQFWHEIKQPTTLLTSIQQARGRLSEYNLFPTPLALRKLSSSAGHNGECEKKNKKEQLFDPSILH